MSQNVGVITYTPRKEEQQCPIFKTAKIADSAGMIPTAYFIIVDFPTPFSPVMITLFSKGIDKFKCEIRFESEPVNGTVKSIKRSIFSVFTMSMFSLWLLIASLSRSIATDATPCSCRASKIALTAPYNEVEITIAWSDALSGKTPFRVKRPRIACLIGYQWKKRQSM